MLVQNRRLLAEVVNMILSQLQHGFVKFLHGFVKDVTWIMF